MPVTERIQEPGAYYNVGVRGARQLPIAFDDRDCALYVRLFATTVRRFDWRCVAWCLMPNHVHFAIQIAETNLSKGMHFLNHSYARWLNGRHGYSGHAFDRRFYAGEIKDDPHLFELARYIVLNPVRAGLCKSPEEWCWSTTIEQCSASRRSRLSTRPDSSRTSVGPPNAQSGITLPLSPKASTHSVDL